MSCRILLVLIGCVGLAPVPSLRASDEFEAKVAPVFQKRCLSCHNDQQPEGGFSLSSSTSAMSSGVIEPADVNASHLIELITATDGKRRMPKDGDPLSPSEIEAIVTWIGAGAVWPASLTLSEAEVTDVDWWSFRPIERPKVPKLADESIRTPIDAFILRKLQQHQLTPSPQADRRTLIRRLYHDLIGLPPTPAQVHAFVNDEREDAYELLVDQLLDSPHYGERWARHWLDVVKYADTCGYDKDKLRPNAWPYRDYVIRSFNEDKPYERFVQEQIAGDILFPGEPDGVLGLGFIAAGPWDFIGHVEVPESKIDGKVARNLDRDDMVSNAMNTFCSLTVQCARCHNHKFDPITQQHYYGLQAIFSAVDRAERPYDLDPAIEQRRRELRKQVQEAESRLKEVDREIEDAGGDRLRELESTIAKLQTRATLVKTPDFGYHSAIEKQSAASSTGKWVEIDLGTESEVAKVVLHPCHDDFAGIGAGFGFPVRFRVVLVDEKGDRTIIMDHADADFMNPSLSAVAIELTDARAASVRVEVTELAPRRGDYIFALSELRVMDRDGSNLARGKPVTSADSIESPPRWGRQNLTDGKWPRYQDEHVVQELMSLKSERHALLEEIETAARIQARDQAKSALAQLRKQQSDLPKGKMVYAAATHFKNQGNFHATEGTPRPVHLLHRGNVQTPGEIAPPSVLPIAAEPTVVLAESAAEGERRATLAEWLTRSTHPLVWRSIVNRVWQYHFGKGIVSTPNDFGRMGATPTHPDLLDWLAVEFRDGGESLDRQSFKSLHRLIVTSRVYRQASAGHSRNQSLDASNRFLWRVDRRRLEAEEIRDAILQVSGTLDPEMGGPGFYLFALERTEHSPHYEYHKFDPNDVASHRRSIYRFIVRSQPDPWMTTLDCADSSQSTPQRIETLTSLQALSLLNSRFNLAMAEHFAENLQRAEVSLEEQVEHAFKLVTLRKPEPSELEDMMEYARHHGLPNLCRFLFNLSEFVYLD
jgi:hypothetical protein